METIPQVAAVIAVLGLLAASLWLPQRGGLARFPVRVTSAKRMQVLERLPLSAQHAIHLVRIEEKVLIVASAPGGCTLLGSVPGVQEPSK